MKLEYFLGAAALSLLLAGTAYPQQEQEKEKPQQEQEKPAEKPKQQPKQQQKQDQHAAKQPQQQEKQQKDQQQEEQQSTKQEQEHQKQVLRQQQQDQKQQEKQQQQMATQQRQQSEDQQRQAQRSDRKGGDHGRRIPEDRFRASFGREHRLHVERRDDRRFQYGGFWFAYGEPWPAAWLYDDDFYIEEIDGEYYLIDLTHPGIQLLLVVE
jgi:hypothetical protein